MIIIIYKDHDTIITSSILNEHYSHKTYSLQVEEQEILSTKLN